MDEADDTQQSTIDNYTGVAIKVREWPIPEMACAQNIRRYRSTRKLMKAYGYNSSLVVKNLLLPSLRVCG